MPRASITLTDLGDGHLRFPYSASLVANLKSQIPSHARARISRAIEDLRRARGAA